MAPWGTPLRQRHSETRRQSPPVPPCPPPRTPLLRRLRRPNATEGSGVKETRPTASPLSSWIRPSVSPGPAASETREVTARSAPTRNQQRRPRKAPREEGAAGQARAPTERGDRTPVRGRGEWPRAPSPRQPQGHQQRFPVLREVPAARAGAGQERAVEDGAGPSVRGHEASERHCPETCSFGERLEDVPQTARALAASRAPRVSWGARRPAAGLTAPPSRGGNGGPGSPAPKPNERNEPKAGALGPAQGHATALQGSSRTQE